jgi:hypothetical protein
MTLQQETGLELSRATMDGWVMQVGQMLMPVVGAMMNELLGGSYLQADETPVDVQMRDGRGHNHQAYLWQYSRPGGAVVFDFRLGRGREGPKQFLGKFSGILQTDGYIAYEHVGGPGMVHAGCWSHARRGFCDVVKLNPGDPVATPIVKKINELFASTITMFQVDPTSTHKSKVPPGNREPGDRKSALTDRMCRLERVVARIQWSLGHEL